MKGKKRPARAISGSAGFTLLEVLVALAILGLAMGMLTSSISDSLERAERMQNGDRAASLAEAMLARLGEDILLRPGITQGRDQNLTWRMVIAPAPGHPQMPALDKIDLTVKDSANHIIGHWQSLRVAP